MSAKTFADLVAALVERDNVCAVWLAYNARQARDLLDRVANILVNDPATRLLVSRVRLANGAERIELSNGSRILFTSIGSRAMRGLRVDIVVCAGVPHDAQRAVAGGGQIWSEGVTLP